MNPEVRGRLIAAAKRVVVERGLAAEVVQITHEATASTATFYKYFSGRDDILCALLHEMADELRGAIDKIDRVEDAAEALRAWMMNGFDLYREYGVLASYVISGLLPEGLQDEVPSADVFRFTGRLIKRAVAAGQLRRGLDVRAAVRVWFGLVTPMRMEDSIKDGVSLDQLAEETLDVFFSAYSPR